MIRGPLAEKVSEPLIVPGPRVVGEIAVLGERWGEIVYLPKNFPVALIAFSDGQGLERIPLNLLAA